MPAQAVDMVETGGRLPEFWDRSAAFFANLLALFFGNEKETDRLANAVGEVDSYGGRLIPILNLLFTGSDNVLILERAPDESLCAYFRDTLDLSVPKLAILRHRDYQLLGREFRGAPAGGKASASAEANRILAEVAAHRAAWVDGYVTDDTLAAIAAHLGKRTVTTPEGSRRGNNKLLLLEHIRERGLPHVATELAESVDDVARCLEALRKEGFGAAVLKAQIGASGIGMQKIGDIDAALQGAGPVAAAEEPLFFEGPCMVQGWLQAGARGVRDIRSPSVQMFLDDERVFLYDMTEQILSSDSVHEGNVSPPPYFVDEGAGASGREVRGELLRQAAVAGEWLHDQGYRGTASTDFLVVEREGRRAPEVYVCEINARVTGATYPSVLARYFTPEGAWLLRNLRLTKPVEGAELLAMLDGPGHLYRRGNARGVLPINFNFGSDGLVRKGQFLCLARSPEGCHEYLRAAEVDLPAEWTFDRD